jgi:CheY-like chemotaxis protein
MQPRPFVLIIEDSEEVAEIYAEIFEVEGILATTIRDGAVALHHLETLTPDLILLDMYLPNVSGEEILAFIRNSPRLSQTEIIVITANALLSEEILAATDATLIKPVDTVQIRDLALRMLA